MTQCSLCCDKWHYGSSVQDATPNLDLSSRLTNERCLTIHSIMQSPVLWLDLQKIQRADNSDTEGSRKDLLTIPPHFHRSAGLPDVQTSSQVLQATMCRYIYLFPLHSAISSGLYSVLLAHISECQPAGFHILPLTYMTLHNIPLAVSPASKTNTSLSIFKMCWYNWWPFLHIKFMICASNDKIMQVCYKFRLLCLAGCM